MSDIRGKKVAFILAPANFRDEEYFQPKVILQARGVEVATAAKGNPEEIGGTRGGKAHTDTPFEEVKPETYDGLVFVGGKGAKTYFKDKKIHNLIISFYEADKVIGAICSAPTILAYAGVLRGRKATVFENQAEEVRNLGVTIVDQPVVTDGRLVTAYDVEVAIAFGEAIARALEV